MSTRIITFELINRAPVEVNALIDECTYSYAEDGHEDQFNSSMSTVAENIKEE